MSQKCVKGYIVAISIEPVREALDQGRIGPDHVEVTLGDGAALLDEKIDSFRWYPVKSLEGIYLLAAEAKGGDRRAALLELGEAQFQQVSALGVHQQLSFSEGKLKGEPEQEIVRWGRLVSTMIRSVYNFGEMDFGAAPAGPDRYAVDWRGIEGLGDAVLETTLGFVAALVRRSCGPEVRVTLERPARDHARYTFGRG